MVSFGQRSVRRPIWPVECGLHSTFIAPKECDPFQLRQFACFVAPNHSRECRPTSGRPFATLAGEAIGSAKRLHRVRLEVADVLWRRVPRERVTPEKGLATVTRVDQDWPGESVDGETRFDRVVSH